jgi:hypothetical protein
MDFAFLRLVLGMAAGFAPLVAGQQAAGSRAPAQGAEEPQLWNTRLAVASGPLPGTPEALPYLLTEAFLGRDATGDGDLLDQVIEIAVPARRALIDTGRAWISGSASFRQPFGSQFALPVSESGQGRDLNGDGDRDDTVLSTVEIASGIVRDLGLEARAFFGLADVLVVSGPLPGSAPTGPLSVYDARRGVIHRLGRSGSGRATHDGLAVLYVSEKPAHVDFNADGDKTDEVVQIFDVETGTLVNTGLAVETQAHWDVVALQGRTLLVPVWETAQRTDLDGNGVLHGSILVEYDLAKGTLRNTRLPADFFLPARSLERASDAPVYLRIDEDDTWDLNRDGDMRDEFNYLRTVRTGKFVPFPGGLADSATFRLDSPGERYFTGRSISSIAVPRVLDTETGETRDLGLGTFLAFPLLTTPALLFFMASEELMNVDLNGDGDRDDEIGEVHDLARNATTDSGLAVETDFAFAFFQRADADGRAAAILSHEPAGGDRNGDGDDEFFPDAGWPWVVFAASESDESRDLDQDGDLADVVLHAFHVPTRRLFRIPDARLNFLGDGLFAVTLDERARGDLNGDGDALDQVLHFVEEP